jgi:5-methylcytosine-specific restriction endonuclease McrA
MYFMQHIQDVYMETRICKDCGRELELETNFFKRSDHLKCGRTTYILRCKLCQNKHRRQAIRDNPVLIEHERARGRRWQENNPEKVIEQRRKYYASEKGRETKRIAMKRYYATEYGTKMRKIRDAQRKARKKGAEGTYTQKDIDLLYELQAGYCAYGPHDLRLTGYHIDHVMPLARGGSNYPSNLALACPTCNMEKHDKTVEEWMLDRHS